MRRFLCTLFIQLLFLSLSLPALAGSYQIGTYYFPGWTETPGEWWSPPWERIRPYPEREPLLGWYEEKDLKVAETHIDWAAAYGLDFFAYDWYWTGTSVKLNHAIDNYLKARNKNKLKFCLLWANHTAVPTSERQFSSMVDYWIRHYFKDPQYLKIDQKPVVIIFSPQHLRDNGAKFGADTKSLLDSARWKAVQSGLKGIYFVAATPANAYWVMGYIPQNGYDAITGFNYHSGHFSGEFTGKEPHSRNYQELVEGYQSHWEWILKKTTLPYLVPMSAGWSKRPWGSDTPHDNSVSDPQSFKTMLRRARSVMDREPEKTMRMGIIYSWNEFGEGSYIEPTKKWGFQYLQGVKDVFR